MSKRLFLPSTLLLALACGGETAAAGGAASESNEQASEGASANAAERPAPEPVAESLAFGGEPPMSDVEMRNVDDSMVSIDSVRGEKGTLVLFTCNHCPYAIAWQERIVALAHEYMERGIGVIAINANDPDEYPIDSFEGTQARAQELGMRFPYVIDDTSNVARAFGAEKTPEAYLFDGNRRLVYHGAIDDSQDPANVQAHYLRDALAAVEGGTEVAQRETLAVGCTIKFREG